MVQLPALSDSAWKTIRENSKLTDKDVSSYDQERQRLTIAGVRTAVPKDLTPDAVAIASLTTKSRYFDQPLVSYGLLLDAAAQTPQSLGLCASVGAAQKWFQSIEAEYWPIWRSSGELVETYTDWLNALKRDILTELESIWKGRSGVTDDWFEQTCRSKIEEALSALIKAGIARAREVEIQKLSRELDRVALLDKVCARANLNIKGWGESHNFPRTPLFDWKAAGCQPSKGKVSKKRSDEFWEAVLEDAERLGLPTRTNSD